MNALRLSLVALLLAAGGAQAQSPGEIAFWESVRDSRNPVELQAYVDQYPNGTFVAIAKARLTALQKPVAPSTPAVASTAPRRPTLEPRTPRPGDAWTYRLSFPKRLGMPDQPPRTYEVKVSAIAEGKIVDQLSIDGGTPAETAMPGGTYLVPQGVSIFSPYLPVVSRSGRLARPEIFDPPCKSTYFCEASARVIGNEVLTLPAGKFDTVKVRVDQTWRASGGGGGSWQTTRMNGGRTLTVWYAPSVGRAIKFQSRLTVGDLPPVDTDFDLELVSYQLK